MAFSFHIGTKWYHNFPKLAKESGFHFNTHKSRIHIDWNHIDSIDIDRVIIERDFITVDENINNVINYNLKNEYDLKILDSNFVKVFRLAQLAVEYLLYCKQYLDQSVIILKDELKLKIEDNHKLRKEITALEEIIKNLKDKAKERNRMIETKIGDSNGEIHKCPHCPKSFISITFVKAHIARRHPYTTDLSTEISPVHDHYKIETEKLHNEIKLLKERLNQAEKVIKNESDKISNGVKIDNKDKENESENDGRYNVNKYELIERQQIKNNEEINDLKSLLLSEINNLRHRNESPYKVHDNVPEINVKLLISQQEREIERLRNQLLEKLTPDIEKMHDKLRMQEDHWKSKIQQMEHQHRIDIEKITSELKLTQQAAEFIKTEYEFKVNALEKQSKDQSSILIEQSKQLSSLSHGLQNSQIQTDLNKYFNNIKTKNIITPMIKDDKSTHFQNTKIAENGDGDKIRIENTNSMLKQKSRDESVLLVPKISQNYNETKQSDKVLNSVDYNAQEKRLKEQFKSTDKTSKKFESFDVVKVSEIKNENQINHKSKLVQKHSKNPFIKIHSNRESFPSILNDKNESTESNSENVDSKINKINVENHKISKNFLDVEVGISSVTSSYTTTESETGSDSEVVSVKKNNVLSNKNEVISSLLKSTETSQNNSFFPEKLKKDILETFQKKLRDLGIDPEWNEIPQISYKQKMKIIRHHQSIYSKKFLKYNEIKHNILKEVLHRISIKNSTSHQSKSVKRSPLDKLVTNVKSKAMKTFSIPKSSYISPKKFKTNLEDEELKSLNAHDTYKIPRKPSIVPKENEYISKNVDEKENNEINENDTFPKFLNSQKRSNSMLDLHTNDKNQIQETSSNIIQFMNGEPRKTSTPNQNDSISLLKRQEVIQSFIISPKHNKGSLKSTTVTVGNSIKKKVLFNLKDKKDKELSSSSQQTELNDSDWNISSISDEKTQLQKRKSPSADNIVLKTTQAEKIAEISKKIEKQLLISRKKPIGSIEAMFPSASILENNKKDETQDNKSAQYPYLSSISISSSSLENLSPKLAVNSKVNGIKFPLPTPRNLQKKEFNSIESQKTLLITNDTNLEADIDDILETE
ncbi:zinc finger protein Dzip1-like [Vespa mandarinia]|uniref:zinc finger protein Dzip1-like n=1 Tax=Vespa mandarinia TaxID=7446 RepID=UPI00160F3B4F|nr:zinc finger protein Dzip1-like [Vespa mandarinia]